MQKFDGMIRRVAAIVLGTISLLSSGPAMAQEQAGFQHPEIRIPKLAAPPAIDGKIDQDEWADSALFTGVAATGGGVGPFTMVPEMQQVQWRLAYDDRYLYLAMRSPHKKGTYPVARVKDNDSNDVLFEDHVEIQICPFARDQATKHGKGFFKVMVNPKGTMIDQHLYNGTIDTEELWSTGGETKCRVTEEEWTLEMSIELARVRVDKPDGKSVTMQLVRTDSCIGIYFAGWAPYPWLNWGNFADVVFDPATPVVQFERVGEVMAGDLDTAVTVLGGGAGQREVTVEVAVENAEGKVLYREKQAASVTPDERKTLTFAKAGLPVTPVAVADNARNWYEIKATVKDGAKEVVLYRNRTPFVMLNDDFRAKHLDPWLAGRPQSGEWEYRFAYLPYANRAEIGIDLDFFGIAPEITAATTFKTVLRKKGGKKALAEAEGKIENLTGGTLIEVPELEEGDYEAVFTLANAEGKIVSTKTSSFERKKFPFEHNTLGVNDEVIQPFNPLVVRGSSIEAVMRTYQVGDGGLLNQLWAKGPTGQAGADRPRNLLAAPMRLELTRDGKAVPATDGKVEIKEAAGHRVNLQGSQQLGDIKAKVDAMMEYDGWYEVTLSLAPSAPGATAEALDLVMDLPDFCDTLYVQRMGDGRYGNRFGAISKQPGVQFKSTDLLRFKQWGKDWKSFVPQTYIGDGDAGLWFLAWSDAGWELREEQPMLQIERLADSGLVRARVRLLAGPVTLDQPRKLRFAFLGAPVKPNFVDYRSRQRIFQDTNGYRHYGDSVDGYALHRDEDYEALRKFFIYGPRYQEDQRSGYWINRAPEVAEAGSFVLYGSTWMGGAAAPEHKSFGGEWFGNSNWKPTPDTQFAGMYNYQGTVQWNTPEQLMATGYNWTQSHTDFFIWYHKPLMEKIGLNGTWWDNSSIGTIKEYDPELGRMDLKWNLYARRQLTKRLNHLNWELMCRPMWVQNMHVDMPFSQRFWLIENDWGAEGEDITAFDQWTLDEFRAMARTKSTVMYSWPWLRTFRSNDSALDQKIRRSLIGICFAHDIVGGEISDGESIGDLKRKLIGAVDFENTAQCLFTGYWRSAPAVEPVDPEIKASFYANAQTKSAVVLFINPGKGDQYLGGSTFDLNALISPNARLELKRVYDLETGEPVQVMFENGRYRLADAWRLPKHEFRALAVEAK